MTTDPAQKTTNAELLLKNVGIRRPVASVPKPAEPAPQLSPVQVSNVVPIPADPKSVEDRLTALEKDVSDLKTGGSGGSVEELTQRLDDAGILREHPAPKAAALSLHEE